MDVRSRNEQLGSGEAGRGIPRLHTFLSFGNPEKNISLREILEEAGGGCTSFVRSRPFIRRVRKTKSLLGARGLLYSIDNALSSCGETLWPVEQYVHQDHAFRTSRILLDARASKTRSGSQITFAPLAAPPATYATCGVSESWHGGTTHSPVTRVHNGGRDIERHT